MGDRAIHYGDRLARMAMREAKHDPVTRAVIRRVQDERRSPVVLYSQRWGDSPTGPRAISESAVGPGQAANIAGVYQRSRSRSPEHEIDVRRSSRSMPRVVGHELMHYLKSEGGWLVSPALDEAVATHVEHGAPDEQDETGQLRRVARAMLGKRFDEVQRGR